MDVRWQGSVVPLTRHDVDAGAAEMEIGQGPASLNARKEKRVIAGGNHRRCAARGSDCHAVARGDGDRAIRGERDAQRRVRPALSLRGGNEDERHTKAGAYCCRSCHAPGP